VNSAQKAPIGLDRLSDIIASLASDQAVCSSVAGA